MDNKTAGRVEELYFDARCHLVIKNLKLKWDSISFSKGNSKTIKGDLLSLTCRKTALNLMMESELGPRNPFLSLLIKQTGNRSDEKLWITTSCLLQTQVFELFLSFLFSQGKQFLPQPLNFMTESTCEDFLVSVTIPVGLCISFHAGMFDQMTEPTINQTCERTNLLPGNWFP